MIQIINTGVANIRSLQAAFDRLGQAWNLTEDAAEIKTASHVVLPGVGAFAAAAESLDRLGVREAVKQRLQDPTKSTLCICCLLYTSPSPRDKRQSRMPSSA